MNKLVSVVAAVVISACTHALPGGSVVMKVTDQRGHASLGSADVNVGDPIVVERRICVTEGKSEKCEIRVVGRGRIVEVYGLEYSVFELAKGEYREGDRIEVAR